MWNVQIPYREEPFMPGGGSRKDEKLVPSAGGVQGWVAPDRKDPPRRLRLLRLSRGDFQGEEGLWNTN